MPGPSNQHLHLVCRKKISNIWCLKTQPCALKSRDKHWTTDSSGISTKILLMNSTITISCLSPEKANR